MSNVSKRKKDISWGTVILWMVLFFPVGIFLLVNKISLNEKKENSWGVVIMLLLFFFPVGIPLLIRKVTSEKHAYGQNGKTMVTLGWTFIGMGFIYLTSTVSGERTAENGGSTLGALITVLIFFVGGGAALVFFGNRFKTRSAEFDRYLVIVNNRDDYSIDSIATAYPATYDKTCKDLQLMIDSGYFINSYLDLQRRELVLPKSAVVAVPRAATANITTTLTGSRIGKCSSCGAVNTISNAGFGKCEYCGSPLD